jgi:hypothetical protein
MLSFSRNAEMRKDQDKNENVIDAQRLLDQVTSKELERAVDPLTCPDDSIESQAERPKVAR